MPGDTWLSDYDVCAQEGHHIMERIHERNTNQKGSSAYTKQNAHIRAMIRQFSIGLSGLRQSLVSSSKNYQITQREIERRQAMLDQLAAKEKQLETAFKNESGEFGHRTSLMDPGLGASGRDPWAQAETDDMLDMNIDEIRQQQSHIMREQDEGLEALSHVLGRQKQMALDIGNEVDYQNDLIDDIGDHVDQTDQRLIRETRHIKIVDRKSGACGLWVVIVLLFIAIIVIVAIPKP